MQEIDVLIDVNGDVKIEGKGIEGADCKALTKAIEEALGDVTRTTLKPEYHLKPKVARKAGA